MSSTEQKNITQPFISSCHTFGIIPTILTAAFDNYGIETGKHPFEHLGFTEHLGIRLRSAENPGELCRELLPSTDSACLSSRSAVFLLKLCSDSTVYSGNRAVLRLTESILIHRWSLHISETSAVHHAKRHVGRVSKFLAPGAYSRTGRTEGNIKKITSGADWNYLKSAADTIEMLSRGSRAYKYERKVREWCIRNRESTGLKTRYRSTTEAAKDLNGFNPEALLSIEDPPELNQKWITVGRKAGLSLSIHHHAGVYYIKIKYRFKARRKPTICTWDKYKQRQEPPKDMKEVNELYVLSHRDLKDISFLLNASAHIKMYHKRRLLDIRNQAVLKHTIKCQQHMWALYTTVMEMCSRDFDLRNKLGVYFDVLQWRYLAWKSGDMFYDHSRIMGQKVVSKGLVRLPDQYDMLNMLKQLPVDIAVDLLGMYKASIYPEVDPFKVVVEQYQLHMNRHVTDWQPGTQEHERFEMTRCYMWYLGVNVLHNRFGTWPGKIREGVEQKNWHKNYKTEGIPGNDWRDAHDVDLSNCVTVADITDEQYMKQQDSACAPPLWSEYRNYEAIRKAPRRHRRKLLYSIQESELPSLPGILSELNRLGEQLPEGYVDSIDYHPDFSTDIVTGSRCERHKDAPRPFYAASPPWGCILSYFDGITRDFLNHVPQSMLGKSTRQKFTELKSATESRSFDKYCFYMSDDKAKYSPHMDPQSQQLPADFFSELFGIPGMKAFGPVMYHCELYYRVNGHLVHYNSNGTDREGMRGASNTWLEIVAQGLSTRLCREKKLIRGKSMFLSFIDDGLRKFSIDYSSRDESQSLKATRDVIDDVIFGLKVLGRELSWDKTFISRDMFVILNELVVDGSFISSGLKSFCTSGDIEMKEVMSAPDYEQIYFGKMRGAHGVGAPLDICHYVYVFNTLMEHYKMGIRMQDNKKINNLDYRLFCITPVALGGAGIRSPMQLACNEVASATKEGLGNLIRLCQEDRILMMCVSSISSQPLEQLDPVDFMREPEQFHVSGPRLKTQRMAAEVRKRLRSLASNDMSRKYIEQDTIGMELLRNLGRTLMAIGDVGAEEVRLLYACTPVAFIDEFVQKLASSSTLAEMLDREVIGVLRRAVKRDIIQSAEYFSVRCGSEELVEYSKTHEGIARLLSELLN